jgi:hypothetical protein
MRQGFCYLYFIPSIIIMASNKKIVNRQRRVKRRPMDPIFTARGLPITSDFIPVHVIAPTVNRRVRLYVTLTSAAPTFQLTYLKIAQQDGLDYIATAVPRYYTMRVTAVRAWAESPNSLSVSQNPYGLLVQDASSAFTLSSRPITGSRLCALYLSLPFNVRAALLPTSSTNNICTFSCDQTMASLTDFDVIIDATVEFYS